MVNVWTGGSFDVLHAGHIHLFRECWKLAGMGGRVTVAVNTDDFIARFKPEPIQSLAERLEMVMAIRYVDHVQINDGHTQQSLIANSGASVVVIGDDWADRDYVAQLGTTHEWLDQRRITIRYLPRFSGLSSTDLKRRIRATV